MKKYATLLLALIIVLLLVSCGAEQITEQGSKTPFDGHLEIVSGQNTISPFSTLTRSRIDNGDGTFAETVVDKASAIDLVSGKTPISVDVIPSIVLDTTPEYRLKGNGQIVRVGLISKNGDAYVESETTFEALSHLSAGQYYVVMETLFTTNGASSSYQYENIFCLEVKE